MTPFTIDLEAGTQTKDTQGEFEEGDTSTIKEVCRALIKYLPWANLHITQDINRPGVPLIKVMFLDHKAWPILADEMMVPTLPMSELSEQITACITRSQRVYNEALRQFPGMPQRPGGYVTHQGKGHADITAGLETFDITHTPGSETFDIAAGSGHLPVAIDYTASRFRSSGNAWRHIPPQEIKWETASDVSSYVKVEHEVVAKLHSVRPHPTKELKRYLSKDPIDPHPRVPPHGKGKESG